MSVKGLDTGQQLAVVTAGDQHLGVCAGGGLQERERAGGELVLFDLSDLIFTVEMRCKISLSDSCMSSRLRMRWNVTRIYGRIIVQPRSYNPPRN